LKRRDCEEYTELLAFREQIVLGSGRGVVELCL